MMRRKSAIILGIIAWVLYATAVSAADALEQVQGRIILTVRGDIERSNSQSGAQFDLMMLEKLPWKSIKTATRWTSGVQLFEGVPVVDLLEYIGAQGESVEGVALDGYISPPISVTDLKKYGVILALKKNGEYLKVREKGPIWMIYPMDDFPELQSDLLTQYKLIWHLRTLIIK